MLRVEAVLLDESIVQKYSPSQPRDGHGRWTGMGAGEASLDDYPRMFGTGTVDMGALHGVGVTQPSSEDWASGMSPEDAHSFGFAQRERPPVLDSAAKAAADYRRSQGLPEPDFSNVEGGLTNVKADLARARRVATAAFVRSQENGGKIGLEERVAYNDLTRQTSLQLAAMDKAGITVEYLTKKQIIDRGLDPTGQNPYPSATAQRNSVASTHRLMIASLVDYPKSYHHILDSSLGGTYDQFRAVHDYFGHVAAGTGFDRHGEFQAYLHHASMFSGAGRRAAASELHVENSFLAATGQSSPHFGHLLPDEMVNPYYADGTFKGLPWVTR